MERDDTRSTPDEDITQAFDPLPLTGIAKAFPVSSDEKVNLDTWKKWAEKASVNGLIDTRIFQGRGRAQSKFDPWLVSEWLISKGHYSRNAAARKVVKCLPPKNEHLKVIILA